MKNWSLAFLVLITVCAGIAVAGATCGDDDDDNDDDSPKDCFLICAEIVECGQTDILEAMDLTCEEFCVEYAATTLLNCLVGASGCKQIEDCFDDYGGDVPFDDDSVPDDDDNDTNGFAPVISNGYFDPDHFTWTADCFEPYAEPCTYLTFSVCDEDDNLSGGGIYLYGCNTTIPFDLWPTFPHPFLWDEWSSFPDVTDCDAPQSLALGLNVDAGNWQEGTYWFCVDIEVTDGAGNVSNRLEDIVVSMFR